MLQARSLTPKIKNMRTPYIIARDYPNGEEFTCRYCEQRFINTNFKWKRTWEHLNNDKENNELWNLAWAHWQCNQQKKNNPELQVMAHELIKRNKQWEEENDFEFARERKIKEPTEEQTEIDLNMAHHKITEEFLAEKLPDNNAKHTLSDAVNCIVLRCRKKTSHGSSQAVRNYLNVLSCSEGLYKVEKIDGKNYIMRRSGT